MFLFKQRTQRILLNRIGARKVAKDQKKFLRKFSETNSTYIYVHWLFVIVLKLIKTNWPSDSQSENRYTDRTIEFDRDEIYCHDAKTAPPADCGYYKYKLSANKLTLCLYLHDQIDREAKRERCDGPVGGEAAEVGIGRWI